MQTQVSGWQWGKKVALLHRQKKVLAVECIVQNGHHRLVNNKTTPLSKFKKLLDLCISPSREGPRVNQ